jgi:hypothetical protein
MRSKLRLELAGAGFLHDGIAEKTLSLANAVDVINERRKRVHFKAERNRPARVVVTETFSFVESRHHS